MLRTRRRPTPIDFFTTRSPRPPQLQARLNEALLQEYLSRARSMADHAVLATAAVSVDLEQADAGDHPRLQVVASGTGCGPDGCATPTAG